MSLSYQKLQPVRVRDPRVVVDNQRQYAVLSGGKKVQYKAYTSTSISTSSIQFSCPPPSGSFIIDRKMYLTMPIRLTFAGTSSSGNLLVPGSDAPRAYPLSSSIDTLQATINNTSVNINMADMIQALLHYNTDVDLKEHDYSMTATCPDQAQNYSDLIGCNRNPLGSYGDCFDESVMGRGGVQFTVVSNSATAAVVDMLITEPLFLSPFYWGHGNAGGFANVASMDFNVSFLNNLGNRMWSHAALSPNTNVISGVTVQFNNFSGTAFSYNQNIPQMLFTYIAPLDTELINPLVPITYPYFDIARYPTDIPAITYSSSALGAGSQIQSNNIQLATIPKRMFLYVRPNNNTLFNSTTYTDTFYGINAVNIQFNGETYMNSATQQQLYKISHKNGLNMSWQQFSGMPTYAPSSFSSKFGTMGSIICLEFGTDIPLSPYEAPGINGQYNLMVQANVYNCDPSTAHDALPLSFYIVVVSEGTFTIEKLGASMHQVGVLSKQDVLDAKTSRWVTYNDVQDINGGNFLTGLKDFGAKLLDGIKTAAPYIKKGFEVAQAVAPYAAPLLGLGEGGEVVGGRRGRGVYAGSGIVPGDNEYVGGRVMSREELQRRLNSE